MTGIRLGLSRISKILQGSAIPWKAVHVAGTNGKGSVCHHTYNLLLACGVKCGMFSSPHLIDRWDCISVNGQPISKELFDTIEARMKERNESMEIRASPFEILTATAFEAFTESGVEAAVIETGVGGLEDATNIIQKPTPAVITKIGLDHEDLLGKGIQNIVDHKAGIMKNASPCVVDGTNSVDIQLMLEAKAKIRNARPFKICYPAAYRSSSTFLGIFSWPSLPEHKRMHLILAYEAAGAAIRSMKKPKPDWRNLLPKVSELVFPGRQQSISIRALTGRVPHVLLDGCHNEQSASVLEQAVESKYRTVEQVERICWIFAASSSKDVQSIFGRLVKEGDDVLATEFGPVDGMPWISPAAAEHVLSAIQENKPGSSTRTRNVLEALQLATTLAGNNPIVIAGSLYLVSDVLRLLRDYKTTANDTLGWTSGARS